jgi:hypothetical protein
VGVVREGRARRRSGAMFDFVSWVSVSTEVDGSGGEFLQIA